MKSSPIKVFPIAKTTLDRKATRKWLDHIGATEYELPQQDVVTDCGCTIGLAAKRCYMSFEPGLNPNVNKVRKNWHTYLTNILKHKHGSVMEHATWTWAIEGCTRVFTAEMNRHRAGTAISEGSLRYIRFDNVPYWEPASIQPDSTLLDDEESHELSLKQRLVATREEFRQAFEEAESRYMRLCGLWDINEGNFDKKKKLTSLFRRTIPMGVSTGGVWTMNIRAARHIITMRTSPHAEEEIAYVVGLIAKEMCSTEKDLMGDFECNDGFWQPKYEKV